MAKDTSKASENHSDFVVPSGYEDCSNDTIGTWDSRNKECSPALHFVPVDVIMIDNNVNPDRASIMLSGKVLQDTKVVKKKSEEIIVARKGELVGVWYGPGMRGIESNRGIPTFLVYDCEIPMGGGKQPMRKYRVLRKPGEKPSLVPIRGDFRKESRGSRTPFDGIETGAEVAEGSDPNFC